MQQNTVKSSGPWWKYWHVWMVVGGPAVVVIACMVTIYLAITRPDPLVNRDRYYEASQTMDPKAAAASLAPAGQARNHAATGVLPAPASPAK